MARIGIDARESGTSTGRYVDKLIEHLHKLQPEYEIVVLAKPHRIDYMKQVAPNFEIVESDYKEFSFGEQYGLVWQLYGLRADLVHFVAAQQPLLYFGKTVTTIHDLTTIRFNNPSKNWLVYKFKQQIYRLVVKWVAHKSKSLITASQTVKYDLSHFAKLAVNKITTIYEAADKITDDPQPIDKLKGQRFLLYVGRPMPHKNLERLVDAFAGLRSKYPKLKLVLAGKSDANYRALQSYVDKKGVQGVVFTDFITDSKLRWLYENATAYVFPSLSEGFGLPGLEAMQYDLPVVASRASCLPEIYKDAAYYFDPLDINDMALKIGQVLDNKALGQQLAANGRRVAKQYSWAKTAKQTLAVYEQVLKNSNS